MASVRLGKGGTPAISLAAASSGTMPPIGDLPLMDTVIPEVRSRMMSRVRNRDTAPELRLRSFLHRAGLRFRIHPKLPGSPDVVLRKYRATIFVHGCFWHQHPGCGRAAIPKSNVEFWRQKFERNKARDAKAQTELRAAGWRVKVVWECEINNTELENLVNWIKD